MCLWQEGTNNLQFQKLSARIQSLRRDPVYRFLRFAYDRTSLQSWRGLVVSVPAGKICKIYGWSNNQKVTLTPGYHELTLPWDPQVVWAGITENAGDLPENMVLDTTAGL
jgi:hypothetical protein